MMLRGCYMQYGMAWHGSAFLTRSTIFLILVIFKPLLVILERGCKLRSDILGTNVVLEFNFSFSFNLIGNVKVHQK